MTVHLILRFMPVRARESKNGRLGFPSVKMSKEVSLRERFGKLRKTERESGEIKRTKWKCSLRESQRVKGMEVSMYKRLNT
jgi:hypothetical protein